MKADTIQKQYERLGDDCSQRLQELNLKSWVACKKLLGNKDSYQCESDPKLSRSIESLIQLLEDSSDSNYRRLDLLEEMLESDLQLFPLFSLDEGTRIELQDVSRVTISHYDKNPHLITKE